MPPGDPQQRLDVAQAAGGTLDVGFQVVLGVVVLGVPGALLGTLGQVEGPSRPEVLDAGGRQHRLAQVLGAGQGTAFHEVGDHRQVGQRLGGAFAQGSDALPHGQAHVPQQGQEAFDGVTEALLLFFGEQDEQVDVRVRMQFATAIAAHREQGDAIVRPTEATPGRDQHLVDEPGAILD